MALFRRGTEASGSTPLSPDPSTGAATPRSKKPAGSTPLQPGAAPSAPRSKKQQPSPAPPVAAPPPAPGARKDRPTPSRREAEAARRQRVRQTLSAKEARRLAAQQNRAQRLKAVSAREAVPERTLMRDYVDARFSLGEFLLPSLVIILALSFLSVAVPNITYFSTILMYVFILAVLADCFFMWRGFKKVLAERLPGTSPRGLLMYGVNRAIQIRRFRIPPPRIKRGDTY